MRVWVALEEEQIEKDETTYEFKMEAELECDSTKRLLILSCQNMILEFCEHEI